MNEVLNHEPPFTHANFSRPPHWPRARFRAAPTRRVGLGFSLWIRRCRRRTRVCAGWLRCRVRALLAIPPGELLPTAQEHHAQLAARGLTALMDNLSLTADDAMHAKNLERIRPPRSSRTTSRQTRRPCSKPSWAAVEWDKVRRRWPRASPIKGKAAAAANSRSASSRTWRAARAWAVAAGQVKSPAVKLACDSAIQLRGVDLGKSSTLLPHAIHPCEGSSAAGQVQFVLPGEGD